MKNIMPLCILLFATLLRAEPSALFQQLSSDLPMEADAAYQQLLPVIQPTDIPILKPLLQNPIAFDRALALLEALQHPLADQALAQALDTATNTAARIALLNALSRRRYSAGLPAVQKLLHESEKDVKSAAMYFCACAGDKALLKVLTADPSCTPDIQFLIAERLFFMDKEASLGLYAKLMENKTTPDHLRLAALLELIRRDDKQPQQWISLGLSSDSEVWRGSTAQIAAKGSPDMIAQLIKTATPPGRRALLTALANTGNKGTGHLFRLLLTTDCTPEERLLAVQGLAEAGNAKDVPALIHLMESEAEPLADAARTSLGRLSDPAVNKAIAKHLDHVKPGVAVKLLSLLVARKAEGISDKVADMLSTPFIEVRIAAYQALMSLATVDQVNMVIKHALQVKEQQEQQAAERAILYIARSYPKVTVSAMTSRFSKADVPMKSIFIRATGVADTKLGLVLLKQALEEEEVTLTDEAVRVLSSWKTTAAMSLLEPLLSTYPNQRMRILALRGYIRLIPQEPSVEERARQCAVAEKQATRTEEKNLLIDAYVTVPTSASVAALKAFLSDETLKKDAARALRKIAQTLPVDTPDAAPGSWIGKVFFETKRISDHRSEACCVADFNGDGKQDIAAGPFLYLAPEWKPAKIREVSSDVKEDGKGYADDFCNLVMDVNGDGKPDILSAGWFSKTSFWFENTIGKEGLWPVHTIEKLGNHETGLLADMTGNGRAEMFLPVAREAVWYERVLNAGNIPEFKKHPITNKPMMLGLGTGDVNGDGRPDVLYPTAWFQAPVNPRTDPWLEHPIALGGTNSTADHTANILVFDVNKDGLNDIITSTAHKYGIWWYEQKRDATGTVSWGQHLIDNTWTQAHYLLLADIDNDGKNELITGKRFMAHNGNDPDESGPLGVYYYSFTPGPNPVFRKQVISYDDGIGAGLNIIAVDIDNDGDLDLVTTGKWGGPVLFENQKNSKGAGFR